MFKRKPVKNESDRYLKKRHLTYKRLKDAQIKSIIDLYLNSDDNTVDGISKKVNISINLVNKVINIYCMEIVKETKKTYVQSEHKFLFFGDFEPKKATLSKPDLIQMFNVPMSCQPDFSTRLKNSIKELKYINI